MNEVCVNTMINDLETGAQYLVLWIAPGNEYGYWHDLRGHSRVPARFIMSDVVKGRSDDRYDTESLLNPDIIRPDELLDAKKLEHRNRIWAIMQPVVEEEPGIYEAPDRAKILRKTAEASGVERAYLYKLLDRYWRSGKTKNAFIPAYSNSGAKGRPRKTYKKRNGELFDGNSIGKTLTDSDRHNFAITVKRYYLNRKGISFKAAYEKLLQDFYTVKSEDDPEKLKLLAPSEIPSFRQFQYWYHKNRDHVIEQKKRKGERAFELSG